MSASESLGDTIMSNYQPIRKYISEDNKKDCWEYLKNHNLANRGKYDGDKEKQFLGLVAETETHNLLKGYYLDLDEQENKFDGGVDINYRGATIDVKAMGRNFYTQPEYANNFLACQLKYKCDMIIFASVNKKTNYIEFCGWIWKKELETRGKLYKKGDVRKRGNNDTMPLYTDMYEVQNEDLRDIREILNVY